MLITTSVDLPDRAASARGRRAKSRALSVVLDAALGSPRRARFTAELLDERRVPVFASAGELTPYGAQLLAEEVRQTGYGARVDLFVGPERATALRLYANRQIGQLHDRGLAIHVHE